MNELRIAAIAGFVNLGIAALGLYWWQYEMNPLVPSEEEILFAVTSIASVFYWYGFARVGKKFRNDLLFGVAVFQFTVAILFSSAGVLYEVGLFEGIRPAFEPIAYFLNLGSGIALLVAGIAFERIRKVFGDIALWYGVISMVCGALYLANDFGMSHVALFSSSLNIVLYLFGSLILLQAAKR